MILRDIQRQVGVTADGQWGPETAAAIARALGMAPPAQSSSTHGGDPYDPDRLHSLRKPEAFFDGVRALTRSLDEMQVAIINALLARAARWSVGQLAYGLATAWHESRLRPIEEIGKGRGHAYGVANGSGKAPYGRGLVQLTWHSNYVRADDELRLNGTLAADYDRALEPEIAVSILVRGMEEGWFTGRKLADMISSPLGTHEEFVRARRIINGIDRAEMIADHADVFKSALIAGGWA